jgi:nicotinamide mononucleotide (NMN) deamidase PncC
VTTSKFSAAVTNASAACSGVAKPRGAEEVVVTGTVFDIDCCAITPPMQEHTTTARHKMKRSIDKLHSAAADFISVLRGLESSLISDADLLRRRRG